MSSRSEGSDGRVVVIGSAVIDDVHNGAGVEQFLGGTGFNLAIALALEGVPTALAASLGGDEEGEALTAALAAAGVAMLLPPDAATTRHVATRVTNGEPHYRFADAAHRQIALTPVVAAIVQRAEAVVVNSFPFESADAVSRLAGMFAASRGLRLIDPNPRPGITGDIACVTENLRMLLPHVDIVKISRDDLAMLDCAVDDILAWQVQSVFLTRGAEGAELFTASGERFSAAVPPSTLPPVDAIGAGDAALAGLLAAALGEIRGSASRTVSAVVPRPVMRSLRWDAHLANAMRTAAECCREAGGPAHARYRPQGREGVAIP